MDVDITKGEVLDFYVYFLNREGTKTFDKKRLEQEIKSRKNKIWRQLHVKIITNAYSVNIKINK